MERIDGLLAGILNRMQEAVVACDEADVIVYMNEAAGKLFGDCIGLHGDESALKEVWDKFANSERLKREIEIEIRGRKNNFLLSVLYVAGFENIRVLVFQEAEELFQLRHFFAQASTELNYLMRKSDPCVSPEFDTFRSLVEELDDMLFRLDRTGKIIYVNKVTGALLTRSLQSMQGACFLDLIHPPDIEIAKDALENVLNGLAYQSLTIRFSRPGRKLAWLSLNLKPERQPDGTIIGIRGLGRDVTREKEIEGQLREQEKKLLHTEKLSALGSMAAGIVHELKQPFSVITMVTDILRKYVNGGAKIGRDEIIKCLDSLDHQVEHTLKLVEQMRTFSRVESAPRLERVSMREVVQSVERYFLRQIVPPDIEMNVDYGTRDATVMIDVGRFEQVLINVISNARDAVRERFGEGHRGGAKKIALGIEVGPGEVCVDITDNGNGIPEEIRNKIMDPFFTTKTSEKGTGLGLSLSVAMMHEMNGDIYYETEIGKGTTFTLEVPLAGSDEVPGGGAAEDTALNTQAPQTKRF